MERPRTDVFHLEHLDPIRWWIPTWVQLVTAGHWGGKVFGKRWAGRQPT